MTRGGGFENKNDKVWQEGEGVQKIPFCEWRTFWVPSIVIAYCDWCKEKRLERKINNWSLKLKKKNLQQIIIFCHVREESPFTKYEEDNLKYCF